MALTLRLTKKWRQCGWCLKKSLSVTFKGFWIFPCKSRSFIFCQAGVKAGLSWAMGGSWANLHATCHLASAVHLNAFLLRWVELEFVLTCCKNNTPIKYLVLVTVATSWIVCKLMLLFWWILCVFYATESRSILIYQAGGTALPHAAFNCV